MKEETIAIGMIVAAQNDDEASMNEMIQMAVENNLRPKDLLGCLLGLTVGLLSFLEDEGYATKPLLQNLALTVLTEDKPE